MNYSKMSRLMLVLSFLFMIVGLLISSIIFPSIGGFFNESNVESHRLINFVINILLSIPCYALLIFLIITANKVKRDGVFEIDFKKVRTIGFVLLFSSSLFVVNNLVTVIIEIIKYSLSFGTIFSSPYVLLIFIGFVGAIIGTTIVYISNIVKVAKHFKDDSEAII